MMTTIKPLRVCNTCGLEAKTEEDLPLFAKSTQGKHGRHNSCKVCKNKYNKAFYKCDSERRSKRHKVTRQGNKVKALEYKGNKCKHCSVDYNGENECIFDFHHTNDDKEICPSKLMTREWSKIKMEIDKCILLCSNCHRLEHKRMRDG